jgi:hypothetical protein
MSERADPFDEVVREEEFSFLGEQQEKTDTKDMTQEAYAGTGITFEDVRTYQDARLKLVAEGKPYIAPHSRAEHPVQIVFESCFTKALISGVMGLLSWLARALSRSLSWHGVYVFSCASSPTKRTCETPTLHRS